MLCTSKKWCHGTWTSTRSCCPNDASVSSSSNLSGESNASSSSRRSGGSSSSSRSTRTSHSRHSSVSSCSSYANLSSRSIWASTASVAQWTRQSSRSCVARSTCVNITTYTSLCAHCHTQSIKAITISTHVDPTSIRRVISRTAHLYRDVYVGASLW